MASGGGETVGSLSGTAARTESASSTPDDAVRCLVAPGIRGLWPAEVTTASSATWNPGEDRAGVADTHNALVELPRGTRV